MILTTGVSTVTNVKEFNIGSSTLGLLGRKLRAKRSGARPSVVFFIDKFFEDHSIIDRLPIEKSDRLYFVNTLSEPTTDIVDNYVTNLIEYGLKKPCVIVGMGGGSTMVVAKAVSNLLTNHGKAEDYQGWDLVKRAGVYKIGIPTISGTGMKQHEHV